MYHGSANHSSTSWSTLFCSTCSFLSSSLSGSLSRLERTSHRWEKSQFKVNWRWAFWKQFSTGTWTTAKRPTQSSTFLSTGSSSSQDITLSTCHLSSGQLQNQFLLLLQTWAILRSLLILLMTGTIQLTLGWLSMLLPCCGR